MLQNVPDITYSIARLTRQSTEKAATVNKLQTFKETVFHFSFIFEQEHKKYLDNILPLDQVSFYLGSLQLLVTFNGAKSKAKGIGIHTRILAVNQDGYPLTPCILGSRLYTPSHHTRDMYTQFCIDINFSVCGRKPLENIPKALRDFAMNADL